MRVPSTFPGFSGSGEDAFFADPPASSSTATPAARDPQVLTAFFAAMANQEPGRAGVDARLVSPSSHTKDAPVAAAFSQATPPSKANAMAYFERFARVRKVAGSSDLFSPLA
jgi:hypothetical protein